VSTNYQDRIMRTYEVTLTSPDADTTVELVNLSYELNEQLDAVNGQGAVVTATSVAASVEVMKRLRKLAEREATLVSAGLIDTAACDLRMVRQAFVKVPVDETGVPIPHRPQEHAK
jgi:hypothetical protein